jgi:HNH endonuclease
MARDYVHERKIEDPARKDERAARNRARLIVEKAQGKSALRGKEVEHKDGRATNNKASNLKIVTPKDNNQGRRGGPATSSRR